MLTLKESESITSDRHTQWWILGDVNEAATSGLLLLELSRGPPSKNGVCSFGLFKISPWSQQLWKC